MPDATPPVRWTLLSLRPRGQHAGLRKAAARAGGQLLALSPLAVVARAEADTRRMLDAAQDAGGWVFTSPNAVRAAHALHPLAAAPGRQVLAVGAGTRRALQRLGVAADAPDRMDSEGLLAMPGLQALNGRRVALFTAPGGRNRLAPALRARGAQVVRVDVYARVPIAIPVERWRALGEALRGTAPVVLALSSGEALQAMLAQAPPDLRGALCGQPVVAASDRLATLAREAGFARIALATDARPAALVRAARNTFV
jgi:uroporphyrinogen-III synthase